MTRSKQLDQDRAAALGLMPVSHETAARLDLFVDLFLRWQRAVQLVAPSTLGKIWTRHIADSLQLLELAPTARVWVDLGSGGGFPGLVIAIALVGRPNVLVHLIESDTRKAAFLREAARQVQAPVKVTAGRIEEVISKLAGQVDVVTARALAPLPHLLALAAPLLQREAQGIFLKSQDVEKELTEASKSWKIQYEILPSRTDPRGRILIIDRAGPSLSTSR